MPNGPAVSQYTYGVAARINGINNVFRVLVQKGEPLPDGRFVELTGEPGSPLQTTLTWRLFRSDLNFPVSVLGPSVVSLGTVRVQCPISDNQAERRQTVRFMFCGSEISVVVANSGGVTFGGVIKA